MELALAHSRCSCTTKEEQSCEPWESSPGCWASSAQSRSVARCQQPPTGTAVIITAISTTTEAAARTTAARRVGPGRVVTVRRIRDHVDRSPHVGRGSGGSNYLGLSWAASGGL